MPDSKVPPLAVSGKVRGRSPVGKKNAKDGSGKEKKSPRRKSKVSEEKADDPTKTRRAKSVDGPARGASNLSIGTEEANGVYPLRRGEGLTGLVQKTRIPVESPVHTYRAILAHLSHITSQGSTTVLHQATNALLPEAYKEENVGRIVLSAKEVKHLRRIVEECETLLHRQEELRAPMLLQRAIRTFLAKQELARIRASLHPSAMEFHSFIKGELRYLDSLAILVDHFFAPLRNTADPEIRERAADIHAVFCNIDELEAAALGLVRRLRGFSSQSWPQLRGMGTVFIELAPKLAVYDRYAENHVFARECLRDLMATCKAFSVAVEATSSKLNVSLPDLLRLPLEHLSTYPNILRKFDVWGQAEEEKQITLNAVAVMDTRLASVEAARAKSNQSFFISQVQRTLIPSKKPYTRKDEILTTLDIRAEGRVFKTSISVDMRVKKGAITKKTPVKLLAFSDVCLLVRRREEKGEMREEKNELLDVFYLADTVVAQQPGGFSLKEVEEDQGASSPSLGRIGGKRALAKERRFACETDGNASHTVTLLQSLIDQCQHRVFAIDLDLLLEREAAGTGVPTALKLCGEFLRDHVEEEGILRIPGSKAEADLLVQLLNKSTAIDLASTKASVHDVGTVFKLFLSVLPQPIVSQDAREKMVVLQQKYEQDKSKTKYIRALRDLLQSSRKAELSTLQYVSELMYDLAHMEKGKDNKMTCENLATCVGPDVMQPEAENMAQVLLIPVANNALGFLFEHHFAIFDDL